MIPAIRLLAVAILVAGTAGAARADVFYLNYEGAGVQHSTATFTVVGVETFDSRTSGAGFTTNFGTNGAIAATYSAVRINSADRYGGAGGTGKYAANFHATPYSLHFTSDAARLPNGINYFGYWLSALDAGNQVTFFRNGTEVGRLTPGDVLAQLSSNRSYYGNPNAPFKGLNTNEPYAFINFYDRNGSFDEVRFAQTTNGGGYESDNHTVGFYTATGGTPEPGTWVLLVTGFGLVGVGLRRRTAVPDGFARAPCRAFTSPAV